ncbi:uncharacterized protein LOC130902885 [Diorhabda carinulata]|uniref:uncharacterized protein LOC130902885 n=1 Tax=Diorhabda carinulata TaxID=1163345 RepID=UPI0025A19E4B|nr:uncharacterized protein LOC130902885 [Diorhabda carinulata]
MNAIKRFHKLESKLINDTVIRQQYSEFMREYEKLGHMTKVPTWATEVDGKGVFYLPHHGVVKDSATTKLRVVFDASAKTGNGISLNDTLMVGPTIQEDLFAIIIRFRQHNVAMVADIEKMYRQVEIVEEQRDLQRIMWRSDPNLPLEVYTLNTVTYGTAPASFIAIRCLHQLALENSKKYPVTSQVITRDFYVDDLITGTDTIENAQILRQNITNILESGSFPLRKWKTNKPNIFNDINNISDLPDHYLSTDDQSKALGLVWNSQSDTLHFSTDSIQIENNNFTKREILSVIAQLFDPLGLVGPVIVKAKVIMQKLWQHKVDWDQIAPSPIISDDASTIAYGACSYLRTVDNSGQCSVRLICAKSRVAPLKVVTLPRLELNAALLATNLTAKLMEAFTCRISNIFYYNDSTIVLSWLNTEPALLKTFVANRVADIQGKSKIENWQHVKSEHNAADIISRGSLPSQLLECDMWWNGPFFLSNPNQPVEATLNSRPLIPLTDDPNDLCPLTPSHFLIGDVLKAIPQSNVQQIPVNRLSTYHALQQMYHHYWRRWSSEYVSTLQQRVKWKTASKELLNIGALALLKDKNSPPLYWALARIVKLHPGSDGITRVVTLRAKNGILRRAVSEICVLPIDV